MTTVIRNQGTSLAVREKLAADGRPVLLAFSCGKDSIAAWLAMRDMGIEVVPAYLYYVPGLRFVDEELDYFEQKFQTRIKRYPHAVPVVEQCGVPGSRTVALYRGGAFA